jgi:gas vesicle protein
MTREEAAGAGNVVLAFILGAVSGAALALLYAPTTGQGARDYLGGKAREGRDRAANATERSRDIVTQGRATLSHALERGREAYQQARTRETT